MNILQKSAKHFLIIGRHKFEVFKACIMSGLYWQAITHDLSKYTPSEFIEYAKYYNGEVSPVDKAKQMNGYCNAWMHHKGHNPHHYEYWIDNLDNGGMPLIMPYKYAMEMVCDYIGAGKTYNRAEWSLAKPLEYWNIKKKTAKIHPKMIKFYDRMFYEFSRIGYSALEPYYAKQIYRMIVDQ